MNIPAIRFDDGAAYERYMGVWSRLAAGPFLDWLAPGPGRRWLDVGCGNGAFTGLLLERFAPASVHGVDPSAEQLAHARAQPDLAAAVFEQGDAMALPYTDECFDVAVMPLVIFFVPEPERGVAEMRRVVAPGGVIAAYAWDMPGGGFPYFPLIAELRAMGKPVPAPPSANASRLDRLQALWQEAGLADVATCGITVQRSFDDFDDYWRTVLAAPSIGALLAGLTTAETARVQAAARAGMTSDANARLACHGRANAVKGTVPLR